MLNYTKYTYKLYTTQKDVYEAPCLAQSLIKTGDNYHLNFVLPISETYIQDANNLIKLRLFGCGVEHDRTGTDTDYDGKPGEWIVQSKISDLIVSSTEETYSINLDEEGIITISPNIPLGFIGKTITFQVSEVSESDQQPFIVNVSISIKRTYKGEKLNMFYRVGDSDFKQEQVQCISISGYPYYQATTLSDFLIELQQEDWDKILEYYVVRPALSIPYTEEGISKVNTEMYPEQIIISNTTVTLPRHMQRFNYKCEAVPDEILLFSFSVVFDKECAASHYYINKIDFNNNKYPQIVDIVVTDGDTNVVNNSTEDVSNAIITYGNVIFHKENIITDVDGYFLDDNGNKIKYMLPALQDNSNYIVYAHLHFTNEIKATVGTTNTNLIIGANDIIDKIHWPGELITVKSDNNVNIQASSAPSDDGLEWFFDLSASLKSTATNPNSTGYAHGDMGIIICENGNRNEASTWYDMTQKASISNDKEVYSCMKIYPNKSLIFSNTYSKQSYEDKGLGSNIFPNDIIGNVPYCKYSYDENGQVRVDVNGNPVDRYNQSLMPSLGKYRYNTFFMKFYTEGTVFHLVSIASGNNYLQIFVNTETNTLNLSYSLENIDSSFAKYNFSGTVYQNNWYTLFLIFNDKVLKGIMVYQDENPILCKILSDSEQINCQSLIDTTINKDNFLEFSDSDYIAITDQHNPVSTGYICKTGLIFKDLDFNITAKEPLDMHIQDFIGTTITQQLLKGYTMTTSVTLTHKTLPIQPLIFTEFVESKPDSVSFYLPLNEYDSDGDTLITEVLPKGEYTLSLDCNGNNYATKDIKIKHIKPDDTTIGFECDFKNNYTQAVSTFIDRFYVRQEKRAGDLSGGENGNNVYFNRMEGCLVLENHGDYYGELEDQKLPCNQKAPLSSYYIGIPAKTVEYALNEDNSICYYDSNHTPDPYSPMVKRVGSLVQSKDYYGYGEWKMRMKIPKDFTGAAICWWVFHYQEHYPNNDNRYLDFYTGGLNKENRPVVSSLLGGPDVGGNYSYEESYLPYNYLHDYGTDSGKPYLKINNEIDMEMGSEMCSVYGEKAPSLSGITFHVSAIDAKTVYFCITPGDDYGLWVVDYDNPSTQSALRSKFTALKQEYQTTGIDKYNSPNVVIAANELQWIHVSTDSNIEEQKTLGDWQQFEAHKTWGIRWNNWFSEGDNSTGILSKDNIGNLVDLLNNVPIETINGWASLNAGASMTLRTPLGDWDIHNEDISKRFIPRRYDDDQYHEYRFEYRRDYTAVYIDDILVKVNRMNVPFIPMAALIGVWFPTFNSWDVNKVWGGHFGGWGGLDAKWDVRHAKVSYISYRPYSAEEEPRDKMIYHPESFPADGLRKIEGVYIETEKVTLTINAVPLNAEVKMNNIKTTSLQVDRGSTIIVKASAEGYRDFEQSYVVYSDTTKEITLTPISLQPSSITTMEEDYNRITDALDTLIEENGAENLVMWSLVTDQHATLNDPARQTYRTDREAEIVKWMTKLRQLGEAYNFSVFLNGGDITGYLGEYGDVINGEALPIPLREDGTIPDNDNYTSEQLTQMNQNTLDNYYSPEYNACTNVFKDNPVIPMMFAPGNHDRLGSAGKYRCYIPLSFTKTNTITPFENVHSIFTEGMEQDSNYTYYDDEVKKVRFIVLDSYYDRWKEHWFGTAIGNLDNNALKLCFTKPSDWKYIILQHDGYTAGENVGHCIPNNSSTYVDCETSVDFTGVDTSKLIVCLNGHGHISNQALIPTLDNKVFEIITQASSAANDVFSSRTKSWDVMPDVPYISIDTVTGHAIDIFVYNKQTEDLRVLRWGAGADRYFNLNQNNPTFKYVTFKASFSSNSITDFNGYKLLLSSRFDGNYDRNRKNDYKTNIFLNLNTEGKVDSNNKIENDSSFIIGIPYQTNLKAYLLDSSQNVVWTSEVFTTSEWSYDWNINLDA